MSRPLVAARGLRAPLQRNDSATAPSSRSRPDVSSARASPSPARSCVGRRGPRAGARRHRDTRHRCAAAVETGHRRGHRQPRRVRRDRSRRRLALPQGRVAAASPGVEPEAPALDGVVAAHLALDAAPNGGVRQGHDRGRRPPREPVDRGTRRPVGGQAHHEGARARRRERRDPEDPRTRDGSDDGLPTGLVGARVAGLLPARLHRVADGAHVRREPGRPGSAHPRSRATSGRVPHEAAPRARRRGDHGGRRRGATGRASPHRHGPVGSVPALAAEHEPPLEELLRGGAREMARPAGPGRGWVDREGR